MKAAPEAASTAVVSKAVVSPAVVSEGTGPKDAASKGEVAAGGAPRAEESQVVACIVERSRRIPSGPMASFEAITLNPAALARIAQERAHLGESEAGSAPPAPEEFMQLFHEYERYVASIGNRILGPNNGVDDLVQEVFLVIYQEFHKLRELSSIKAWLATITTRLAWRQRGRPWLFSKLSLAQMEELNPLESTDASPELQADLATLLDRLRSMPDSLREPWLLRFIDGETLPRIAELCDCSQSTVQRRLREAGEVMLGEKAAS
jgi:RNA polymerase sigma-70 factor, ECF subfamily